MMFFAKIDGEPIWNSRPYRQGGSKFIPLFQTEEAALQFGEDVADERDEENQTVTIHGVDVSQHGG